MRHREGYMDAVIGTMMEAAGEFNFRTSLVIATAGASLAAWAIASLLISIP